jgi:hypothetical protein
MNRGLSWVGLVVLIGSVACGDDDTSTSARDGGMPNPHDASVAAAQGSNSSGSTKCPEFEPLSDAIARFEGNWLIDDAEKNSSCPNATLVVLEGYEAEGLPTDPARNNTCPAPSALFMISNTAVKDCLSFQPVCSTLAETRAFFIHAWPKAATKGKAREELFTNEKILAHSNNEWSVIDDHIMVYLGKTQADDKMIPGGSGVVNFKRTGMVRGDCMQP